MPPIKVRAIISGLKKKGFCQSNRDHKFFVFYYNEKKTSIFTKVSHGISEIGDDLIKKMSCQVKLDKKKFKDLINCPLSFSDYLVELREQGYNFE